MTSTRHAIPSIIASRYRVLGALGRGSMGQVLRVEHVHTGEQLALKALFLRGDLNEQVGERFKREARAWTLIKSEHVVRVLDAGISPELGGAPYLVMELLDGTDLEEYLARVGKLRAAEVATLIGQIARALQRAHSLGMVHRDIKPANLFLHRSEGRVMVKVLDFGLLKLTEEQHPAEQVGVTAPGMLLGTPLYMAPEQVKGFNDSVAPAADIWALGMLVFQLLTGQRYWTSGSLPEMLADIVGATMPVPSRRAPSVGEAFDAWFFRSCERNAARRWPSVTAQWEALCEALRPEGGTDLEPAALPDPGVAASSSMLDMAHAVTSSIASTMTIGNGTRDAEGSVRASEVQAIERRAPSASVDEGPRRAGERRQVTVMFFSPAVRGVSGEVDPEEIDQITRELDLACAEVLGNQGDSTSRFEGTARYVYFGYPLAHGHDALRAVAAALGVVAAASRIDARLQAERGLRLSVRVGIHSGLMVVADISNQSKSSERGLVGAAPSIAVELERAAPPNGIVISSATCRLVRERFTCRSLGTRDLAAAHGMEAFEVVAYGAGRAPEPAETSPIIGREAELHILVDRWERIGTESGQVALVLGEAGIGKSRCLAAFARELEGQRCRWLSCQCSPYFSDRAFYPIAVLLNAMIGAAHADSPAAQSDKLRGLLRGLPLPKDAEAMLASLLSIPPDGSYAPLNLTPQRQKRLTEEVLLALFSALAEQEPLCLVVEDLHWVDPSTLELLSLLVDHAPGTRIFLLLTSRPDFCAPWSARSHITQINLGRLPRRRVEALVRELARGRDLAPEVVEQLVTKTDGVPLFVEELTRMVLERASAGALSDVSSAVFSLNIPSTLRESLTARLDGLGRAKGTAQLASVIGQEFHHELIRALSPLDEPALAEDLAILVARDLVLQRGMPPRASYAFKHNLMQEAAYESLLKNRRKQLHAQIVEVLAAGKNGVAEVEPELLAHHYDAAGLALAAAGQLMRAALGALQRSANVEAENQLRRALSLIASQPDTPERTQLELGARALLGVPLFSTRGYGAPEVEQTYARARELAERVHGSDSPELFPVLWGLWIFYLVRAKYSTAMELAERLTRLADQTPDPGLRLAAHVAQGNTACLHGRIPAARDHLEKAIALYDPAAHRRYAYVCGQDLAVQAHSMLSWALWMEGYPDQALERAREAVKIAESLSHPSSLGFALTMKMVTHKLRGEPEQARETSSALVELSQAQGLIHWLGPAIFTHGWAEHALGRLPEGLDEMRRGREMFGQVGALIAMGLYDSMLIEACGKASEADECLRRLEPARPFVAAEERSFEPELLRVEGELRRALWNDPVGAEAHFQRAIESAARAGSRSFELRAALCLARLWLGQGKRDEARALVERTYAPFTEGFETGDLCEARQLLATGMGV